MRWLRHPAAPALASLVSLIVLAWAYLLWMVWGMEHMDVGSEMLLMPAMNHWQAVDLLLVFVMWTLMMAAMMLPSALPMVMLFDSERRLRPGRAGLSRSAAFVAGYLAVWAGFSLAITAVQWALLEARLVSPMMASASGPFSAGLLIVAGLYQLTPLKQACLRVCRSPLDFLMTAWRPGLGGAWRMGLRHGLYCTGCCWLLMTLLFLLGVMNLLWIVALSAFVLLEKCAAGAPWSSRLAGLGFVAWGLALLLA